MRVAKEIQVSAPQEEAFAYVAEFAHAADWDPGVVEGKKVGDAPVREGTEFEIVALFRGKRLPFHYRVTTFEPSRRLVLSGEGEKASSVDEITFDPSGSGTRLAYVADIRLKGVARLAEPLLSPMMNRMADEALAGLQSVLDRPR